MLWVAGLVSMLGDWILFIALPFYVYHTTGSALATGAMFMVQTLPSLLFGTVAGVYVDRWDRRRTMIFADVARAAALLTMLLAHGRAGLALIYAAGFLEATFSLFFGPAKSALLPQIVGTDALLPANAANSMIDNLTRLVGPSIGGALMAAVGLRGVVLADVVSYLLSGLLIAAIAVPATAVTPPVQESGFLAAWRQVRIEWSEGMQVVKGSRMLAGMFLVLGLWNFGQGIINALLVVFITKVLHGGAQLFGWIASVQGIGGLIGGLLFASMARKLPPLRLVAWSTLLMGALLLVLLNVPSLPVVMVLIAVIGIPAMGCMIGIQTLLQMSVQDSFRGRVFGALGTLNAVTMLVGMGTASLLGDKVGVVPLMDASGAIYLFSSLLVRGLASLPSPHPDPTALPAPSEE